MKTSNNMITKMPFKRFVWIIGIIVLLTGCDPDRRVYTIKGNLYKDCNLVQMPGENILLRFEDMSGFGKGGKDFGIKKTDNNGAFEFKYKSPRKIGELSLIHYFNEISTINLMESIPKDENITLTLIKKEVANLIINLKVDSPYSSNDTLFYDISPYPPITEPMKIAGPFNNGVIDTLNLDLSFLHGTNYGVRYIAENMGGTLWWGIGNLTDNKMKFTLTGCDVYDEVTINLK